jgi:hypothetical protein
VQVIEIEISITSRGIEKTLIHIVKLGVQKRLLIAPQSGLDRESSDSLELISCGLSLGDFEETAVIQVDFLSDLDRVEA